MNGSGILNNIWNELSSNNLTQSDFDTWKSNFIQNPDVQSNVYNYLVENNLTQSSSEDWVANINKDLQAQQPTKVSGEDNVIKDIDTSPAGLFFNVLQQTQPTAAKPLAALASVAKGTVDIVDSMGDFAETMIEMEFSEVGGIQGTGLAPYMAKRIAARQAGVTKEEFDETNPYNVLKLKGLSNVIDKATVKHKDKETGQQLDFTELFEKGEYNKSAEAFVYETAGALPSLLVSMVPGGYAMLGGSAFADKLNTDLFERPDQASEKILTNALVYGGSDAVGEFIGGRYLRSMFGGARGAGKEKLKEAKKAVAGGIGAFVTTAFKGGSVEAMQEAITSIIQSKSDEEIYGDDISNAQHFRQALHAGLIGFALGGSAGTVSTGMNKKNKTGFYEYLAPKSYKNQQAGLFYKLEEAQQDLQNAPDNKKEKFQRRVDKIKKQQEDLRGQLYNQFETMQKEDPKAFELMIEKIQEQHDALDIITGGRKYSESAKEQAKKDFKEAADVVGDLFAVTDINYDSDIELELSKYFKVAEDIDKQNENLWFKAKDLNYDYVDNQEKYDELKQQSMI